MAATFYTELSLLSNLFAISNICLLKSIADETKKKKKEICALIQSVCSLKCLTSNIVILDPYPLMSKKGDPRT